MGRGERGDLLRWLDYTTISALRTRARAREIGTLSENVVAGEEIHTAAENLEWDSYLEWDGQHG